MIDGNQIEIRVFGLMRSGNHAIINWVQNQYQTDSLFFSQ